MHCCLLKYFDRGWADGRAEVAGDFVADVLGAVLVFLDRLADAEVGMLQARVGDGVGAEVRGRGLELRCTVTPTAPVRTVLGVFLLNYIRMAFASSQLSMLSREWRVGLGPAGVVLFVELPKLGRRCTGTPTVFPSRASRVSTQSIWLENTVPKLRR